MTKHFSGYGYAAMECTVNPSHADGTQVYADIELYIFDSREHRSAWVAGTPCAPGRLRWVLEDIGAVRAVTTLDGLLKAMRGDNCIDNVDPDEVEQYGIIGCWPIYMRERYDDD